MTATRNDFMIRQGSDIDFTVQVYADAKHTVVQPLTGWNAKLMVRANKDDTGLPLVSLTSNPAAGLTINEPVGQVTVHVDGTDTASYTWYNGYWDMHVYNGNSDKCVAYGFVSVSREVTHV